MEKTNVQIKTVEEEIQKLEMQLRQLKRRGAPIGTKKLLREHEVLAITGTSKRKWREGVSSTLYPQPIKWGGVVELWDEEEIYALSSDSDSDRPRREPDFYSEHSKNSFRQDITSLFLRHHIYKSDRVAHLGALLLIEIEKITLTKVEESFFIDHIHAFIKNTLFLNHIEIQDMYKC